MLYSTLATVVRTCQCHIYRLLRRQRFAHLPAFLTFLCHTVVESWAHATRKTSIEVALALTTLTQKIDKTFHHVTVIFDPWHWPSNLTYIWSRWTIMPSVLVKDHSVQKLLSEHTDTADRLFYVGHKSCQYMSEHVDLWIPYVISSRPLLTSYKVHASHNTPGDSGVISSFLFMSAVLAAMMWGKKM